MTPEEIKEIELVVCRVLHAQEMKRIIERNEKYQIELDCYTSPKLLVIICMIISSSLLIGYIIGRV